MFPPRLLLRLLLASVCSIQFAGAAAPALRPNILFFISDDQRPDTIQALGNPHIYTPNLDRLVRSGVAMTRAYVMGSMHGAVCVPSRAMIMSGQTLFRVKEDLAKTSTWPEQFARTGYSTFITGKWHNGATAAATTFQAGKNVFLGGMSEAHGGVVHDFSGGEPPRHGRKEPRHHTEVFAQAAIDFLNAHDPRQPFLCYVSFKAPHDPRTATPAWNEFYRTNPPPLPPNFAPIHPFDNGEMTVRDEQLLPWPRTPDQLRKELSDYYACISHVDEQVGRVLATLRARGLETNTLVVFAGDNGLAIGSHGLMGKQSLYEHSVGVPLIFAGPGIPANHRSDALCYLLDIYPTLAELAGLTPLASSEGRSLRAAFTNKNSVLRPTLFTAYRQSQRAVRNTQWKLIRYPLIDRTQLFDLSKDPHEMNDLGSDPAYAAKVSEMLALLREQQSLYGDPAPLRVDKPSPAKWVPPTSKAL